MQSTHCAVLQKRLVAGIAASMLAVVGCSVCVIEHEATPSTSTEAEAEQRPFWVNEPPTSNLAVVELYRSGTPTW